MEKRTKRFSPESLKQNPNLPSGSFLHTTPPNFLAHIGAIIVQWSHTEESMMMLFQELLGFHRGMGVPAREIFFSITSAQQKIRILRKMLERSIYNANKDPEFDEVINEYENLNDIRNDYVHGLWVTHESGKVYLGVSSRSDFEFFVRREVELQELEAALKRMQLLQGRIGKVMSDSLKRYVDEMSKKAENT